MDSGFQILGISQMQANVESWARNSWRKVADELYQEARRILELAQKRVPVKTGALRDSGKVDKPVITADQISVTISFGDGSSAAYAIKVHEDLKVRHVSGRSKYLESVMLEEVPNVARNIRENLE